MRGDSASAPPGAAPSTDVGVRAGRGAGLVLRGVVLNLILAGVKFSAGILGRSHALMADGAESLLDIFSSLMVWGGFRIAARPPDADHPYGHGKAEPLSALAVALFVFVAASWIGAHSVQGILHPAASPHWATLVVLVVVAATKEWFSRRLLRASRTVGSSALQAEAWHHRSDALISVAAFVGISIAVVGGRRFAAADAWAALAACVVIACNGVLIAGTALREVMDTAVPREIEDQVRAVAGGIPGVRRVEKCRVRKSGLSYLVDIHIHVDGELSVRDGHEIARAVKFALIRSPLPVVDVAVHVEPAAVRAPG